MPSRISGWSRFVVVACGLIASGSALQAQPANAFTAQFPVTDRPDAWTLALPTRRAPDAPPPAPPDLPTGADRVTPLTLDAIVRRRKAGGRPEVLRQTVSRTADRIHVSGTGRTEWLFTGNVRDRRRVSGSFIDHGSRTIVVYEESDLRHALDINGWADVLTLGFDTGRLADFEPTTRTRTMSGIRFVRYASDRKAGMAQEVWWSEDQLLASRFTASDGDSSTTYAIDRIRSGVDVTLLLPATDRFPAYRVFDFADWLERH